MIRYPQVLVNFSVPHKRPLEELPEVQRAISTVERELGVDGRVVVRYSGTEAKARVMIEGTNQARIAVQANDIAQALRHALERGGPTERGGPKTPPHEPPSERGGPKTPPHEPPGGSR